MARQGELAVIQHFKRLLFKFASESRNPRCTEAVARADMHPTERPGVAERVGVGAWRESPHEQRVFKACDARPGAMANFVEILRMNRNSISEGDRMIPVDCMQALPGGHVSSLGRYRHWLSKLLVGFAFALALPASVSAAITKSVVDANGNGIAQPGEVLTYSIVLTNVTPAAITDVSVTDVLSAHTTFQSASDSGAHAAGTVVWDNLTVPPQVGATPGTLTLTLTVTTNPLIPMGVTRIENMAWITGTVNPDCVETPEQAGCTTIAVDSENDLLGILADLDDDNDGIPDAQECPIGLPELTAALIVRGGMNVADADFDPAGFLMISPSDFGLDYSGVPQVITTPITRDYSAMYGLHPGAIVVTINHANVHPTSDTFFTEANVGRGFTEVLISGTVGTYVQFEHGQEYFPGQRRTVQVLDGGSLDNFLLIDLGSEVTGGDWTWGSDLTPRGVSYWLENSPAGVFVNDRVLAYGAMSPQYEKHLRFSTNDSVDTHYSTFFVRLFPECDTDGDGVPNRLDLDSDNDGCLDALEGNGTFPKSLIPAQGSVVVGTGSTAGDLNLGNVIARNGIPVIAAGGQGIGSSQIAGRTVFDALAPNGGVPVDATVLVGDTATFTAAAISQSTLVYGPGHVPDYDQGVASTPLYRWEVSTDGGLTWAPVPGANSATLSLPGVTLGMSGNQYKVIASCAENPCGVEAVATLIVGTPPDVSLTKSVTDANGNGIAEPGELLTYTIMLTNTGGVAAIDYEVTDVMDSLTTFVSASNGGTHALGVVTWTGLTVPAGGQLALTLVVTVNDLLPANTTQIANVAYPTGEPVPDCSAEPLPAGCAVIPVIAGGSCPRVPIITNTSTPGQLQSWHPDTGALLSSVPLLQPTYGYGDIAMNADGSVLYGVHFDFDMPGARTIDRVDPLTGLVIDSFEITGAMATDDVLGVNGLSMLEDGRLLAGSALDQRIYLIDPDTGDSVEFGASFPLDYVSAGDFVTAPDGDILAVGATYDPVTFDTTTSIFRIRPDLSVIHAGTVEGVFGAAISGGRVYLIGAYGDLLRVESLPIVESFDPLPVTLIAATGQSFYGATSIQETRSSCLPVNLTLAKQWSGAAVGDTVSVEARIDGDLIDSFESVATSPNLLDPDPTPISVFGGDVLTLSETFLVGNGAGYTSTLACTGNANALVGNELVIDNDDIDVVCTFTNLNTQPPVVTIAKTVADAGGNGIAEPGELLTYTITLTNSGGGNATGYAVTDVLDPNTTFVSADNGGTHAAGSVTWTGLTVPANGNLVLTVTVLVNNPLPAIVTQITNLAYETGGTPPDCSVAPEPANCATIPVLQVTPPLQTCTAEQVRASERWWYFGNRGVIDFGTSGTTATVLLNPENRVSIEGSTVVTDTDGNLLFWAGGATPTSPAVLYNRNQQPMPNGSLLGNASAVQMLAAFPAPDVPGRYFVVTTGGGAGGSGSNPLRYSVVDMSLDGGLGAVVVGQKDIVLGASGTASEALTAVPNADGTGYWVLTYTFNSPNLLAYAFDSDGPVTGVPVVTTLSSNNYDGFGSLYFNRELNRLALLTSVVSVSNPGRSTARLLTFDAASGQAYELASWATPQSETDPNLGATGFRAGYVAEFSPESNYLYVSRIYPGRLYRYDISSGNAAAIAASEEYVGVTGFGTQGGGHIRRAPDGRMYIARQGDGTGSATLTRISSPDAPTMGGDVATSIGFVRGFALAAGAISTWGLPQMVTGCPLAATMDFGDAPASYGTLLADDGARHVVAGYDATNHTAPLMLGTLIDTEFDASPGANADGDDLGVPIDDEDAFVVPIIRSSGETQITLPVTLQNTSGAGATLYGWIDLDRNGRFDANEAATVAVPSGATSAVLSWAGLDPLTAGPTFLRLRLTSATLPAGTAANGGDARAVGVAPDGEVEDHRVDIRSIDDVTPFDQCPAGGFLTEGGLGGRLHAVDITTGDLTMLLNLNALGIQGSLNAAGFNPLDGRIYARGTNPPSGGNSDLSIYALGSDGSYTVYGPTIPGMPDPQAGNVGDVDGDGYLHVTGQGAGAAAVRVSVVDVTPSRPTFMTVVRTYNRVAGTASVNLGVDMAYRPDDGLFYSVRNGVNPAIVTVHPVTGQVNLFGTTSGLSGDFGAQFMTSDGQIVVIDNTSGNQYRIDLTDPALTVYPAGNVGLTNMGNTDGASCPYRPYFDPPEIVKTVVDASGNGMAEPGETLTYSITITNPNLVPLTGLDITDVLDANTTFVSADNGGTHAAGVVTWIGLTVPANGNLVLTVVVQVADPLPTGVTQISNLAYETGTTPPDCSADPQPANCATIPTPAAVTITKTVTDAGGNGIAEPGEQLTYTITLSNSGGSAATPFDVTDVLDANTTFVSADNGGTHAAGVVTWIGLTVPANGNLVLTVVVQVADPLPTGVTQISNLAYETGTTPPDCSADPQPANCATIPTPAAVTITKTVTDAGGNGIAEPGEQLTYTITLSNSGGSAATPFDVTDVLDANTTFVSADNGGTHAAGVVTWIGLTVPANGNLVLTVVVQVADPLPTGVTRISNLAYQTGTTPPDCSAVPEPANCATIPTPAAVTITKTVTDAGGNGIAEPGEQLTYTITLSNSGGSAATPFDVTDVLDANTTFVSADNGGTHAAGVVTWIGLTVPANGNLVLTVVVQVADPLPAGVTRITNLAYQTGTTPPDCSAVPEPANCATLPTASALTVTKALSGESLTPDGIAEPGEELTWTITVRNEGGTAALNTIINETVPDHTTFVGGVPGWTCAGGEPAGTACETLVDAPASTGPGNPGVVTATFIVLVDDPLPEGVTAITNAVVLNDGIPPNCVQEPANPACSVVPTVNMGLRKSVVGMVATGPGSWNVSYLIEIDNTGGSAAVYTLTDTLQYPLSGVVFAGQAQVTTTDGTVNPALVDGRFTPASGIAVQLSAASVSLPAGDSHQYTLTVPVGVQPSQLQAGACNGQPGNGLYNQAAITGSFDLETATCQPIGGDIPMIRLVKTVTLGVDHDGNQYGDIGDVLHYTFVISNPGTVPLSAVQLIDPRVTDLQCDPVTRSRQPFYMLRGYELFYSAFESSPRGGALAPGDSITCQATHTLTADDVARRRVVNTATASGTGPGGQTVSSISTAIYSAFR